MACAAVFLTKGDISTAESLMANITIGTIMGTLIELSTLKAEALISWLGSLRARWKVEIESKATSCCSSAYLSSYRPGHYYNSIPMLAFYMKQSV